MNTGSTPPASSAQGHARVVSPCTVPWGSMNLQADGNRFCAHCQKTVHDFTARSQAEIDALVQAAGGSLCGRMKQRIHLPFPTTQKPEKRGIGQMQRPWRLAASAGLLALGMGMLHAQAPLVPRDSLAWYDTVLTEIAHTAMPNDTIPKVEDSSEMAAWAWQTLIPMDTVRVPENLSIWVETVLSGFMSMPVPSPEGRIDILYDSEAERQEIWEHLSAERKLNETIGQQIAANMAPIHPDRPGNFPVAPLPIGPKPPKVPEPALMGYYVPPKRRVYRLRSQKMQPRGAEPLRRPTQLPWDPSSNSLTT